MNVTLKAKQESAVCGLVDRGRYQDVEEALDQAIRLLDEHQKLVALRAALAVGEEQLARGEGIGWTPGSMDRLVKESRERVQRGEAIRFKPDVIP
jgi:antitoxin ParD1/3/4